MAPDWLRRNGGHKFACSYSTTAPHQKFEDKEMETIFGVGTEQQELMLSSLSNNTAQYWVQGEEWRAEEDLN